MGAVVASCGSANVKVAKRTHGKEYFAESKYGVKASPRVVSDLRNIPRGGGRNQVGRPYQVAGKWYYPKEEPGYVRKGRASWYGSAFHGRLTANGEIYDTARLTAAHPTMPLPSYARITNLANGSSVIVRVNDRGPYHSNRLIDLSQKAATMLDYQHTGTADVKVEYVGRAPLEGSDDRFLMASYRGPSAPDPWGQPASGVMIAMNGTTPTQRAPVAIPGMTQPQPVGVQVASLGNQPVSLNDQAARLAVPQQVQPAAVPMESLGLSFNLDIVPVLPLIGPYVDEKPTILIGSLKPAKARPSPFISSYASERVANASSTLEAANDILSPEAVSTSWKDMNKLPDGVRPTAEYVDVGLFADKAEAARVKKAISALGRVELSEVASPDGPRIGLIARASSDKNTDDLLQAAWNAGAGDAFVVRDDGN
ncbi:septal ring lytic transglycosylase RlpA family protein [Phyllobacterium brassicacearum]|uniref:Endolytic peptidoglycan transglycosylase RlpA n=1 Tax=Phyllobacterium brassicacearum TaxID=314235 RepID=A0A2P7BSL0_9HYPH|nr:septal ring lytic transglycosylase RlpA family protein [Phyllobacterium brassicacearum]PSH69392.1 septal ring lytic transglycosylase RlpA family protein [Phyllobacterium brassicacearum]TDQ34435.1 rare lipoprotein A [Phyllobacterium brassicacearum]